MEIAERLRPKAEPRLAPPCTREAEELPGSSLWKLLRGMGFVWFAGTLKNRI